MRFLLKDVRQWKLKYDLLRFGVLTLVVVVFWGGVGLYSTYSSTSTPVDYSSEVEPLNPFLDLEMITAIEGRTEVSEDFNIVKAVDLKNEEAQETDPDTSNTPKTLETPKAATESGTQ